MDEPILSMPWNCGERDCPTRWHLSTYWQSADGYTVDDYSDGDHDPIDESDIPTAAEADAAWESYFRDCAETGADPLCKLDVATSKTSRQRWQVDFGPSLIGAVAKGFRRNGRGPWRQVFGVPREVRDYLCLTGEHRAAFRGEWLAEDGEGVCDNPMEVLADLADKDDNVVVQSPRRHGPRHRSLLLTVTVEVDEQIPRRRVERDVRRAARAVIKKATQ